MAFFVYVGALSKQYHLWYCFDMTYYEEIYDLAVDNHYLVTCAQALQEGIPRVELAKLAHRGKLDNLGYGVYRLAHWVPDAAYPYAEAVARVGEGAYLEGESVIALLALAPTNPAYMFVATPKRVRRRLPEGIRLKKAQTADRITTYEGVRCQHICSALVAAQQSMPQDRIREAAQHAAEQGYLLRTEEEALKETLAWL
ncbi:MAG: type IV toxin-antitoxin system AbiEi family antitoxin domain-containing protein [Atopobiaceae bacterium]